MSVGKDFEAHETVSELLRLTMHSGLRAKILLSLREGGKTPGDLREETGSRASSISPNLRDLEEHRLIKAKGSEYALTPLGKVVAAKLREYIHTLFIIDSHFDFWRMHDLSGIPPELLKEIGALHMSEIVRADQTDLYKAHENFIRILENADHVCGVSPIFFDDYPPVMVKLVEADTDVKLVITPNVLDKLQGEYEEEFEYCLSHEHCDIRLVDEALVALTVTDQYLSMGLFKPDGTYDLGVDLVSEDGEAVRWGQKLFKYYWDEAVPLK